jgi:hypothetical protein
LATGDGGFGLDPFNLAQNDNELLGKLLSIDVKNSVWETLPTPLVPVTQVSELGLLSEVIKVVGKGIRNPSRLDEKNGIKFLSVAGQDTSEFAFAFESYKKNFGWRPFEGRLPTLRLTETTAELVYPTEVFQLLDRNVVWTPLASYANTNSLVPSNVVQGSAITGVDIYDGKIKELKNNLILTDLSGTVMSAKLPSDSSESELQIPSKVNLINVQNMPPGLITTLLITDKDHIFVALFGTSVQVAELKKL